MYTGINTGTAWYGFDCVYVTINITITVRLRIGVPFLKTTVQRFIKK